MNVAELEIFKAGTHKANGQMMTFTQSDIQAIVEAFDPVKAPVPVVIGHPKANHPAYAWAARVWTDGKTLKASLKEVDPQFAEIVRAGRYKRISVAFFKPDDTNNPTPGQYALRHIGFLGAAAPAVQGLKTAEFVGNDGEWLCFGMSNEAERLRAGQRLVKLEKQQMFLDKLINAGKVLPRERDRLLSFMHLLDDNREVAFADCNDDLTMLDCFKDYLEKQPTIVDMRRSIVAESEPPIMHSSPSFAAPEDRDVDKDGLELHAKVHEFMREHNMTFEDALDIISKATG